MEEKAKRPRIMRNEVVSNAPIVDPIAFVDNCSNQKSRKICNINCDLTVQFYIGKHYKNRDQYGEDDGTERPDIDVDCVEALIRRALPHVLHYSLKHKSFKVMNYPPKKPTSVVLKEIPSDGQMTLNVIAEFHGLDEMGHYEVTVRTAMRKDNYEIYDGDHEIIIDGESSILNMKSENKITNIDRY